MFDVLPASVLLVAVAGLAIMLVAVLGIARLEGRHPRRRGTTTPAPPLAHDHARPTR